jgi:hypothetical protein
VWAFLRRPTSVGPNRAIHLLGSCNNEPHATPATPSWYADSVGRYEGDTLVVDTLGIRTDRPFVMVDMYGTP